MIRPLVVALLALSVGVGDASALLMTEYDKLSKTEQTSYEAMAIRAAIDFLERQGRAEESKRVIALFTNNGGGSGLFLEYIDTARALDAERAKGGEKRRLHLEDALALTLNKHGIKIRPADLVAATEQWKKQTGR